MALSDLTSQFIEIKNKNIFFKSPSYPTSKGAVISFTKYLASYWGKRGIKVNCVSPGGIKNNQNKEFIKKYSAKTILGRMAETKDIVGIIRFYVVMMQIILQDLILL